MTDGCDATADMDDGVEAPVRCGSGEAGCWVLFLAGSVYIRPSRTEDVYRSSSESASTWEVSVEGDTTRLQQHLAHTHGR
jgi:hypothetical protein